MYYFKTPLIVQNSSFVLIILCKENHVYIYTLKSNDSLIKSDSRFQNDLKAI